MYGGARESLLDAAYTALARHPWSAVRMVDVAAMAGVSRQTLYNEFSNKWGLAQALVRRAADVYLAGVDRALASHSDAGERLAATAEWTVSSARGNVLVRAMLTGCWSERLPSPTFSAVPSSSAMRHADGALPSPVDFVALVRDRAVAVLSAPGTPTCDRAELAGACELVVRLTLSCVAAPPGDGEVTDLIRNALHRQPSQWVGHAPRDRGEPDATCECYRRATDPYASIHPAGAGRVQALAGDL
ncbi:TetR/AcrR family transcriptional regulator [Streptomyces sp. NBC_01390]|uniref:TetR/AcrR family transcriptional regulator n=1 Tax=Streptomyces sp. NBC_01390 TaxID=2903850 RepID=UPI00386C4F9C